MILQSYRLITMLRVFDPQLPPVHAAQAAGPYGTPTVKQDITIILEQDLVRKARILAKERGRTLGELLAEELERLVGDAEAIEAKAREAGVAAAEQPKRRKPDFQKLLEISARVAALPVLDSREPDEIIGYDEHGLPR